MDYALHKQKELIKMTLTELKSRFTSIDRIKKGGQKIVYKAITNKNDVVALKIINNAADPRILQEIMLVKTLSLDFSPCIIESGIVVDESTNDNVLYIIEQFIDGISLKDLIEKGQPANLSFAYKLLESLLAAEIELERHHVLHRDINPNNVIIGNDGKIYLIDFGIAKIIGGTSYTKTEAANGPFTPGYAPYEQFANLKPSQDVRTDLFQIGVTVYEYCNGSNPFIRPHDALFQIMTRTMTITPQPLIMTGDTKGLFAQLVSMLMAKNQSQRPEKAFDAMRYLLAIKPTLELED